MTINKNKELKQAYCVEKKIEQLFTGQRIIIDDSGRVLISPCYNSLKLTDLSTGNLLKEIKLAELAIDENEDYIVTFEYQDNHLIVAYSSGLLRHWSLQITDHKGGEDVPFEIDYVLLRTWKSLHVGPIASIKLDPTGTLVATGGSDSSIKIWDIVNNYCTHNFKEAKGVVNTLTFSPKVTKDVYYLLGSADDYVIHVWNLIDSKHVVTLDGHESKITSIVFADNGETFISSSRDKLVMVWSINSFEKKRTIAIFESIETIQIVPQKLLSVIKSQADQSKYVLITGGESGVLKVWNYQTGNLLYTQTNSLLKVNKGVEDNENEKTTNEESQYTLISQLIYNPKISQLIAVSFDKDIIFHDIADLSPSRQLIGHNDEILDIKLVGEQQTHIAVATNSPKIKVFEISTSNCYILLGHSDTVLSLEVFPKNPSLMISSSKDNTIRVWQFSDDCSAAMCLFYGTGHTHSVMSLSTSMMESSSTKLKSLFFLSGSEDTTLKFWKLPKDLESFETNSENEEFPQALVSKYTQSCHDKAINSIAVSPNNQLVATGSQDKTAKLWMLPNLKLHGVIRGHKKGIWHVEFSPVDQVLATCSADSTIKIWSIGTFSCLKTFQGHTSSVLKLYFLDDGMQFISSASDGNLKIWNLKSNECVSTFDAHEGKVWALAKSNDEEMLVTGGDDSSIVFWKNITTEMRDKEALKNEERIQSDQTYQNLVHKKSWFKALKMAIRMGHPFRTLNVLKEMLREQSDMDQLVEQLGKLRQDQLLTLLEYAVHWNTNSKHCMAAHLVIRAVLEQISPEDLLQMPEFRYKVEKLLPYCDRHMARIRKLKQYVTFADFVFEKMKLPDNLAKE